MTEGNSLPPKDRGSKSAAQTDEHSDERQTRLRRRNRSRNLLVGGTLVLLMPMLGLLTRRDIASFLSTIEPSGFLNHEPDVPPVDTRRAKNAASSSSNNSLSFIVGAPPAVPAGVKPAVNSATPQEASDESAEPTEEASSSSDEAPEVNLGDIRPQAPGSFAEPEAKSRYPKLKRVKGMAERKSSSQVESAFNPPERDIRYYKTAPADANVVPEGTGDKTAAAVMPSALAPQTVSNDKKPERQKPMGRARGPRNPPGAPMKAPVRPQVAGVGSAAGEAVAVQPEAAIGVSAVPDPGYRILQGSPDSAPSPNPEKPMTASSPCPRPGWWKNSSTGLCYHRRDSCSAANGGLGDCAQTRP